MTLSYDLAGEGGTVLLHTTVCDRHLELPWAGHLPSLERPAEITALLIAYLRETRPAR